MAVTIRNRRAYFNYDVSEKYEAGIKLLGIEVKAIKEGKGQLAGSFVRIDNDMSVWITGFNIPPYSKGSNLTGYSPDRRRKLLLKTSEIKSLKGKIERKGYTVVPLKVYQKGNLIKVQIGLVRGKKKTQKKDVLIKKQQEREIARFEKVQYRK